MQISFRALSLVLVLAAGLTGCGGSGSGGDEAPNEVVVSRSTAGTVTAVANGGSRTVTLGFNASDARTIANLRVSGLSALPAGWRGPADFSCATVGSGNGCLLNLTYAPTAFASGTLTLTYTYTHSGGGSATGSIDIPFAATVSNNVVATALPAGQVAVIIDPLQPVSQQAVAVTFTPDDGNPASALSITSSLPSDWTSMAEFTCASVTAAGNCRMNLAYTPTAAGSGTLVLDYSYVDNSGAAKTGTLDIPYIATTTNNVLAAASPSATVSARVGDLPEAVTLTFTTDDGNPATGFAITSSLPADWTGTPGFSCGSVDTGNGCQLTLHYQPLSAATGTLNVAYSYLNNSGQAKTGSINIGYGARIAHAHIASIAGTLNYCAIDGADGRLDACTVVAAPTAGLSGIAFHGEKAYVADNTAHVYACDIDTDGSLSACDVSAGFQQPLTLTSTATHLYVVNAASSDITQCAFNVDGSLASCVQNATTLNAPGAIAIRNGFAYISDSGNNSVVVCTISSTTGAISACTPTGGGFSQPLGIDLADDHLYVANQANNTVSSCTINSDGSLTNCFAAPAGTGPGAISIFGNRAYVSSLFTNSVDVCDVDRASGVLSHCLDSAAGPVFALPLQIGIR